MTARMMTSESEMLNVNSTSSRNGGNGNTIMASTTMRRIGTPSPLRAKPAIVPPRLTVAMALVEIRAQRRLRPRNARERLRGEAAHLVDVGQYLRDGDIQSDRN